MTCDLIIKNASLAEREQNIDWAILNGKIVAIEKLSQVESLKEYDAKGDFLCSGFYETHTSWQGL